MTGKESHTAPISREKRPLLFAPYVLTPCQYFEGFGQNSYVQPEKMLMLAVLQDAIDCYRLFLSDRRAHVKNAYGEAVQWIWSDERDWPFSYTNICDALGFDPDYLRQGLLPRNGNRMTRAMDGGCRQLPGKRASRSGY